MKLTIFRNSQPVTPHPLVATPLISLGLGGGSRGNSRGGVRSHGSKGSKSRSRSRPSTQGGDTSFVVASDFVQVTQLELCLVFPCCFHF
jgi:hypothetical protein